MTNVAKVKKVDNLLVSREYDHEIRFCKFIEPDFQLVSNEKNELVLVDQNVESAFKTLVQMKEEIKMLKINRHDQYSSDIIVYDGHQLHKMIYIGMKNEIHELKNDNHLLEDLYKIKLVRDDPTTQAILCLDTDSGISYQNVIGFNSILIGQRGILKIKYYSGTLALYTSNDTLTLYTLQDGTLSQTM